MNSHKAAAALLEACRPIETRCGFVPRFDFQVERPDAERGGTGQSEFEQLAADASSARGRHEIKIIDEAIAAAIFDAVAKRENEVADWSAILPHNPRSREGLAPGDLQQRRFPRIVERMAILEMERPRQAHEHFTVGLASQLECNAHRLTSEAALLAKRSQTPALPPSGSRRRWSPSGRSALCRSPAVGRAGPPSRRASTYRAP